jgi:hypothetical protein
VRGVDGYALQDVQSHKGESMKTFDNNGKLVGEINRFRTADGKSVTTNTMYDSWSGRPVNQNISIVESNGKVTTTNVINGKLLP